MHPFHWNDEIPMWAKRTKVNTLAVGGGAYKRGLLTICSSRIGGYLREAFSRRGQFEDLWYHFYTCPNKTLTNRYVYI